MICEMTLYYKSIGLSLYDGFINLCEKYGYYKEELVSIELKGKEGQEKISDLINYFRNNDLLEVDGVKVDTIYDFKFSKAKSIITGKEEKLTLPQSNVLKYMLSDGSWFVIRPSGTEPKMKIYISVIGENLKNSEVKIKKFSSSIMNLINGEL